MAKVPPPIRTSEDRRYAISISAPLESAEEILALVYPWFEDEILVRVRVNCQMRRIEGHDPVSKDADLQRPLQSAILDENMRCVGLAVLVLVFEDDDARPVRVCIGGVSFGHPDPPGVVRIHTQGPGQHRPFSPGCNLEIAGQKNTCVWDRLRSEGCLRLNFFASERGLR